MELFSYLAGRSSKTFKIGDIEFSAACLPFVEIGEYFAMQEQYAGTTTGVPFDQLAEFWTDRLKERTVKRKDAEQMTEAWFLANFTKALEEVVAGVLIYGPHEKKDLWASVGNAHAPQT